MAGLLARDHHMRFTFPEKSEWPVEGMLTLTVAGPLGTFTQFPILLIRGTNNLLGYFFKSILFIIKEFKVIINK